jgi:peptidyl-prolyl cis-trans isomerase A (cyclophilin A)
MAYWRFMRKQIFMATAAMAVLLLGGCSSSHQTASNESTPSNASKVPQAAPAPDRFTVNLDTSKGPVEIEVYREWAPIGVDHFYQLVKAGFYDGARFFRIVPGFIVQFGIAADPQMTAKWNSPIQDDPVRQHNVRGTLTYAQTSAPNSRSTQMFINLGDNTKSLDPQHFAPIGLVVKGMDHIDALYPGYGESPDQQMITTQGNTYLQAQFPQLDFVKKASIQ